MTKEDKELLLIDLCGRLPYGVKVRRIDSEFPEYKETIVLDCSYDLEQTIDAEWLPYLRPMSSMTNEEWEEFRSVLFATAKSDRPFGLDTNWLNKNMFDYCGLIEKGLALEAPEGMYKMEE